MDPNAFDDPTYNNKKVNAWYFGINNNINAVRPKTEDGIAPPPANTDGHLGSTGSSMNGIGPPAGPLPGITSPSKHKLPSSGLPGLSF